MTKARTIVFDNDKFAVEMTVQNEFLFQIENGPDDNAARILSRKDVAALVEWLQHHLASSHGDPHS